MTDFLTLGGCAKIKAVAAGTQCTDPITLQVCKIKEVAGGKRMLILSDGAQEIQGVLPANAASEIGDKLKQFALLEVRKYTTSEIRNKKYLMINSAATVEDAVEHTRYGASAMNVDTKPKAVASPQVKTPATPKTPSAGTPRQGSIPKRATLNGTSPSAMPLLTKATLPKRLTPIARLNPYQKWTIKARVTQKSDVRTWDNARGSGSLFSVSLLDIGGTEIRATFFNAPKYYEALEQDRVYCFTGGKVKVANKAYTSIKHQYEISFGENAIVQACEEDKEIKKMSFNFLHFSKLPETAAGRQVDVIGVIHQDLGSATLTTKRGTELQKRDLILVDDSKRTIRCTLFGEQATRPESDFADAPVIAIKGCKLGDYGGRSLSAWSSASITVNPDHARTSELRDWYDLEVVDNKVALSAMSEEVSTGKVKDRKGFQAIEDEKLGYGEKADWANVKGTVLVIRGERKDGSGPWYAACPEEGNNKKVIERPDGTWFCEGNQKEYAAPEYRFILSIKVVDETGSQWLSLFNDQAKQLLGKSADELHVLKENDKSAYDQIIRQACWTDASYRLRIKAESYEDQQRLKIIGSRMNKINYAAESKYLLEQIQERLA